MNHETTAGVIFHFIILGIFVIGVCWIGKKMWDEQYSQDYKEWKGDKHK